MSSFQQQDAAAPDPDTGAKGNGGPTPRPALSPLLPAGAGIPVRDRLAEVLRAALSPTTLTIRDDSHKHAGHGARMGLAGAPVTQGRETHFRVDIVSETFAGHSRLARQRQVMALVDEAGLAGRIHALSLSCRTPEEAAPVS